MNKEFEKLHNWLSINRLSLNITKTNFVIFHSFNKPKAHVTILINKEAIDKVKHVKYLGILIDSQLTFKYHINELNKKVSRAIGILYKLQILSFHFFQFPIRWPIHFFGGLWFFENFPYYCNSVAPFFLNLMRSEEYLFWKKCLLVSISIFAPLIMADETDAEMADVSNGGRRGRPGSVCNGLCIICLS